MATNALSIVFGKLDNVMIKCARFKGTTMETFIDKKEFTGNLFEILEESIKFLQNHLHLNAKIEGMRRVEEYEIPLLARLF
jgi:ATP-dependent DNA helicase RecG